MYSRSTLRQPDPVVGMGATILCWSDRHAATIVKVKMRLINKRGWTWQIVVQQDHAVRTDRNGQSESQSYDYFPCKTNATKEYIFDGKQWRECSRSIKGQLRVLPKGQGNGLMIGIREEYYDPSF